MDCYFLSKFPQHLQGAMVCTTNTNKFSESPSSFETTGGRFHPYFGRSNYPRGHFSSDGASYQGGSGSCYQPSACAYPRTYQQQQTAIGTAFSTIPSSRETHIDLSQYLAGDISQLSTLKTLRDVCGLGVANASLANAAWLTGNLLSSTQGSVERTFENQYEIEGAYVDHPFYNRRRRATASEEGMTRTRDKYRVVYTDKQRKGLEKAYEESKFITMETRTQLSKDLDLSDRQIKIWFQNRRAKERRDSKQSSAAESSNSDSDQSATFNCLQSAQVTSSCGLDGNETEIPIEPFQCRYGTNSMDIHPDQSSGYKHVPTLFDSQQVTSCRWSNSFDQGGPRNREISPLGANVYIDFTSQRL